MGWRRFCDLCRLNQWKGKNLLSFHHQAAPGFFDDYRLLMDTRLASLLRRRRLATRQSAKQESDLPTDLHIQISKKYIRIHYLVKHALIISFLTSNPLACCSLHAGQSFLFVFLGRPRSMKCQSPGLPNDDENFAVRFIDLGLPVRLLSNARRQHATRWQIPSTSHYCLIQIKITKLR
jgi:hypothetical protein